MTASMPGQEHAAHAAKPAEQQFIGRRAPGRFDPLPGLFLEPVDVIQPGAADDADHGFGHRRRHAGMISPQWTSDQTLRFTA